MGSWIGGDRDGNPFVTAEVMRGTLKLQSSRVLRHYLEELHVLGSELSLAAHLTDISKDLRALAERYRALGLANVELVFYPGARHEMLNETNRDDVERDVADWLDRHAQAP